MLYMEKYGRLNDPNFIATLNQSYDHILIYINNYLEYFEYQLSKIANSADIDLEDNFGFRQEWFGLRTFTCQYFFRQISHKIQWPQLPNYYRDSNNNYIDQPPI